MERLKITLISLTITILTFMFGPLVLSALIYYGYTYCEDRPEKKFEIKPIPSLYFYAFVALPFIIFYISKQLGIQNNIIEILKYIFNLKLIELYGFDYSIKDNDYLDKLILFSTAHILSIFTVFLFSIHIAKYRNEQYMGLNRIFMPKKNIKIKKNITSERKLYACTVLFLTLCVFVVVYYFALPGKEIVESRFYREGLLNIIFFPGYIYINLICVTAKKIKTTIV